MAKAILVMEMPPVCGCCKFYKGNYFFNEDCRCVVTGCRVNLNTKEAKCPLRELPEKEKELPTEKYQFGSLGRAFVSGWNACLDKIVRENEI